MKGLERDGGVVGSLKGSKCSAVLGMGHGQGLDGQELEWDMVTRGRCGSG